MTAMTIQFNYTELKQAQFVIRRLLRLFDQKICALEEGHKLEPFCDWAVSGQYCTKCGHREIERTHKKEPNEQP